jgi:hypothetical protein
MTQTRTELRQQLALLKRVRVIARQDYREVVEFYGSRENVPDGKQREAVNRELRLNKQIANINVQLDNTTNQEPRTQGASQ